MMAHLIGRFVGALVEIFAESAGWILLGFAFAGIVHEFVPAQQMVRYFGGRGVLPVVRAAAVGAVLPMCSCGVIPAGIGLYRTGASLGATVAFMISTPVINPAAVMLSYGLLGLPLTIVYAVTGVVASILTGLAVNAVSGGGECRVSTVSLEDVKESSLTRRVVSALRWGFLELGSDIAFYILIGFVLAALVSTFIPAGLVKALLGQASLASLVYMALVGIPLYVCAVGSIPLVAALLAKGALPGTAIVFLMAGPATNAAELFAVLKRLGKQAALFFVVGTFVFSILGGLAANSTVSRDQVRVVAKSNAAIGDAGNASIVIEGYSCSTQSIPGMIVLAAIMASGVWKRTTNAYGRLRGWSSKARSTM
jgi:uncharacterized membrane protein YraQ (UPF0718 family)